MDLAHQKLDLDQMMLIVRGFRRVLEEVEF
ncbi:hypothetical protein V6Z12_D05G372200 [Gossypium hirsutum]